MKLKFWGVRGSIPCPGDATTKYGGNTSCIQVLGGQELVVLDAGTGIRELGQQLTATKKPLRIHLLLTHTHWDHIQGFPFFTPIYSPGNELFVYGPRALEKSLEEALMFQMQYSYFPVRGVELAAKVKFTELGEENFSIGDLEISTKSMNHPIRVLAYKFAHKGKTALYTGDNEPYFDVLADRATRVDTGIHRRSEFITECNQRVVEFCQGADALVADAQYTDQEYETKRGWGAQLDRPGPRARPGGGGGHPRPLPPRADPRRPDARPDREGRPRPGAEDEGTLPGGHRAGGADGRRVMADCP